MFIIFGHRWTATAFGQVQISCPQCAKQAFHTAQFIKGKFTFFFIPLIPLSSRYQVTCNLCGNKRRALGILRTQLEALHRQGIIPAGMTLDSGGEPPCPACNHTGTPRIEKRISVGAWICSACLLFCCLPVCWIPLVIDGWKTETLKCAGCGRDLAATQPAGTPAHR